MKNYTKQNISQKSVILHPDSPDNINGKSLDKDSLLFRHQNSSPPRCQWMSISLYRYDRMHLVDAPPELYHELVNIYGPKIQRWEVHQGNGDVEIKFNGYPWSATGLETVIARENILILLECLEQYGFSLYASIDQDNFSEGRGTDVFHCCRRVDWVAGDPIYHA